ncbi:MAG TPA: aldehyde dehydrogenase family protein [Flavobacteriales bacterium]|nr:aldehyde dehydrogenase family protein [Flavobacteriales bacterium]
MSDALVAAQRLHAHFHTGATRPYSVRRDALRRLHNSLRKHEVELLAAMHADMRKPRFEAYMSDVGLVYAAIEHALLHLTEWMRPQRVPSPLAIQVAQSHVHAEPLGVVLIIAPWNYPALLLLTPLVGAIAAGNCAVLKPSEDAPHTAAVVDRIIAAAFDPAHVTVVHGHGGEVVPALMKGFRFDHVFFTGSPRVGRAIMGMAAEQLVPVTLELGGKSPAIVDRTADIKVAAKRIAWSKYFNAGQTCIATDHALVHASVMNEFLDHFARFVKKAYGENPQQSPDYARLVNDRRFEAVSTYLDQGERFIGGATDKADRYIAPTVLTKVNLDSPVMREEIFGPVLPVIPWNEPEEVLAIARRNPFPLAAYIFSGDRKAQQFFRERIAFGGGCINHCFLQFGPEELPFGGVGFSGMGRYHGRYTFDLFSNRKGVVKASTWIDHGLQEPPYSKLKERILRLLLR